MRFSFWASYLTVKDPDQIMLNVHKSLGTLCSCRSGFANKSFGGTSILRDTMVAEL